MPRPGVATVLLTLVAASSHVGYPAWLLLAGRCKSRLPPAAPELPGITVIVPAYRERDVIAWKVEDLLANGYGGRMQILVVADDIDTARAARQTDADVLSTIGRLGKAEAINRGVASAREAIVVVTDANTRLSRGALEALVRWFEDPQVGAVAGEKRVDGVAQGVYWQFESWLKRREAALGTTIGLVGEIAAVRKSVFRPLPRDLAVDDLWLALDVIERGKRIAYEPEAVAYEPPSPTWQDEWERRTRVGAGVLDVVWRRRAMLAPNSGGVATQLWGHRLLRYSFAPVAHLALLVRALVAAPRSSIASLFVLAHVVGGLAAVRQGRGANVMPTERLAAQVLLLQVVALGGLTRYLRGSRPALWPKAERLVPDGPGGAEPAVIAGHD